MEFLKLGQPKPAKKISLIENDGQPNIPFLSNIVTEWQNDPKRAKMLMAQEYFMGNNTTIEKKIRQVIGENGVLIPCERLENTKLVHSFLHKLTNQKVSYLLSKDFSIQTEKDAFASILNDFFDKNFMRKLKNVGKDSVVNGIAWLQVYYDEGGALSVKRIPSEEVFPFWKDVDHTELDAILRMYSLWHYDEQGNKTEIKKVEYYSTAGVWYYQFDGATLIPDPDKSEQVGANFQIEVEEDGEDGTKTKVLKNAMWGKIPFIAFKYNSEEAPLLDFIKSLVDEYDTTTSGLADAIKDSPRSAKVVSGMEAESKQTFIRNFSQLGLLFVGPEGHVDNLQTEIEHQSVEAHSNRLRKDIFEFGGGVDTQNENFGTASSGVALKFRYSDLDMDCYFMANEYSAALERLVWFIAEDILLKSGQDFTEEDVDFVFNTDMAMNEAEVIDNIAKSTDLSIETRLAMHPYVTDVQAELERKKKEQEEALELGNFDDPDTTDQNNSGEEE